MTSFDRLDDVRAVARARAVESFEYFLFHVLGSRVPCGVGDIVQKSVELGLQGEMLFLLPVQLTQREHVELRRALELWLVVIGRKQGVVLGHEAPSETFAWLFAEELRAA